MSDDGDTPAQAVRAKRRLPKTVLIACAVLAAVVALAGVTVRYGVLLPETRLFLEARTDGLKIGRFGRLKIEGLSGDLWRDFGARRLTLRDEKGVWLEARDLRLVWRPAALAQRRFHADRLTARELRILRRPTLAPKGKAGELPVSFRIDALAARLIMEPAFSFRRGVYDVAGDLDVRRAGGQSFTAHAESLLHAGDRLDAEVQIGGARPLKVDVSAREARGGALAGALGLPADQAFTLAVRADGQEDEGRFTARAVSGQTVPLDARGAWTETGGEASGRVALTASTLTAPFARHIGPQATFALAGRKAEKWFALEGRADAENLALRLKGLGDIGRRRTAPEGLALTLATPSLERLVGGPVKGPGQVKGLLRGEASDLRFEGQARLNRLEVAGYGLEAIAGPIELVRKKNAIDVKARLAGVGGAGQGFAAAVLGPTPRLSFAGARLADGRLALRELNAEGAGLTLKASGGRGLLGGLNFKGEARVSNLEAARPGASGAVRANWSAAQSSAEAAWVVSLDARGDEFALGLAELDRLVGKTPLLKGRMEAVGGRISVPEARLRGAHMQLNTAGVRSADGNLAFKLDWAAEGPFRAGPVEILGKVTGGGAVTGPQSRPRADLTAVADAVDVPRMPLKNARLTLTFERRPDGSAGAAALQAESPYGPARGRTDFRFPQGGVDLSGLSVDLGGVKAEGSVSLRRRTPSAADLSLVVTRGAILEAGRLAGSLRVVDGAQGPRATLNLAAENANPVGANLTIRAGRLTADGPLSRLPYRLEANGVRRAQRWRISGGGTLAALKPGYSLAFEGGGQLGRRELRTLEPATLRFGDGARTAHVLVSATGGGRLSVDARLGRDAADIRASLQNLGLELFNQDLTGAVDAELTLGGRGARLDGVLQARLTGARGIGTDPATGLDGAVEARLSGDTLTLEGEASNSQGLKANANLVLPAEASASPLRVAINRTRPMRGRFFADGEVKPLWDLLIGGERSLSGRLRAQGVVNGTLADPSAVGQASVDGGRFEHGPTGLSLREVTVRATFANTVINVSEAKGVDGRGGTVSGAGRIDLTRNSPSSFRMTLTDFQLIDNSQATASASGEARIDRTAEGRVRIAGALTVTEAEIAADPPTPSGVVAMDVIERNRPADAGGDLEPVERRSFGVGLDITLKGQRRIYLRGRGLDAELSLDAHVGGTTARPILTGTARIVRGDYDFAGKRFEFDERSVVYLATSAQAIRLNLTATRADPTLTAVVRIQGTAAKPAVQLTSTPVLPSDEILSQVLFGRSASQLSPVEGAQLASALSALAGGGGFDVVGNLRNFAGLDRLALGGDGESGVTVAGGKYLTDDVYLELIGGGREGTAAQVEWRVRRNLSVLSRIGGQGDAKLSVRWRRDY